MSPRDCFVTREGGKVRLRVEPTKGKPVVIDFHRTDADAVGHVLLTVARELRGTGSMDDLRAERDALIAAVEIFEASEATAQGSLL